jgi:CheY-like chemotaxis protein
VRTILIVDDEFGIVEVLHVILEEEGYRVFTAANGRRALEQLAENKPDLVILDFMMPLLDGPQTAAAMRADSKLADIPIVMVSALPEAAVRKRFDGYQAFFRKPFDTTALLDVIAELLRPKATD